MSSINITFDFKIAKAPGARITEALALALNEGGSAVGNHVMGTLKTRTNVKSYRFITSRVRTIRAAPGRLAYEIVATGKGIPIEEFPVSVTSKGVNAKTWGVDHLFKRSFQTKGGALRARLGPSRYPIRKLYGPALPKELASEEVARAFATATAQFVMPTIVRQVGRVLG